MRSAETPASREQFLEPGRIVERADHREVEAVALDQVTRDPLDVLRRHLVDLGEDVLRVGCAALEHLAAEPEHDQALRRLELKDESSLREALRLGQLVVGYSLLRDLPQLSGDRPDSVAAAV